MHQEHLISHVDQCLENVDKKTKLNERAIQFCGMSSFKVRNFLNLLLEFPKAKYLEIGVWRGSTFYSALYKNDPFYAVAIDDWSGFNQNCSWLEFKTNLLDLEANYEIHNIDSFKMDKSLLKSKFNFYFYDGDHSVESQEKALTYYLETLEDTFLYICDDWNCPEVQEGTRKGIEKTNLKILKEWTLPARFNGDTENWWNGLYVLYASKV